MRYSFAMSAKIYHNPRCSKSRATLALLQARGIDVEIVDYLKSGPSADEIRSILGELKLDPADLIRPGEAAFKESGLTLEAEPSELIDLMVREPIVMQRPIVVSAGGARIGRPPEAVLELFD